MSLPDPTDTPLNAVRVATTGEADGEMHLKDVAGRRGDKTDSVQ
jgi:hypothetical protein